MTFKIVEPMIGALNVSKVVVKYLFHTQKREYLGVEIQRGPDAGIVAAHELGHLRSRAPGRREYVVGDHECPYGCLAMLQQEAEAWRIGLADYKRANGGLSEDDKAVIRLYFGTYIQHRKVTRTYSLLDMKAA